MKINNLNTVNVQFGKKNEIKVQEKINLNENANDTFVSSEKVEKKESFKTKVKNFFNKFKLGIIAVLGATVGIAGTILVTNKQKNTLKEQLNNVVLPENFSSRVDEKVKELQNRELGYDATKRINEDKEEKVKETKKRFKLPEQYQKPNKRTDMKNVMIPVFESGKNYSYEFPISDEMRITHEKIKFEPQPLQKTTISESYADSLNWDNDKISRDLLQNFFDGHNQTLDGVKVDIKAKENGKYTVRIEGKSTFTPDKAILLGESSKKDNKQAAGCFGEGLKMVVLKLLKEKGADNVDIGSANWNVSWKLKDNGLNEKRVLAYELNEVKDFDGNYIEFDVNDEEFLKTLTTSFNKFYHSNNKAFKDPDFENDTIGIKILDKNERGSIFIAGQEFEFDGKYNNLKGANIFLKEKPPTKINSLYIFDPSRDRTSLTDNNVEAIGKWIADDESNMSDEDLVKLIHSLEPYWITGIFNGPPAGIGDLLRGILSYAQYRNDFTIEFPNKNQVSDSLYVSTALKQQYEEAGYKICNPMLKHIGMKSIETLVEETRKHVPIAPTEQEKNKILLIQDALKILSPVLTKSKLFDEKELNPTILIFDKNAANEDKSYENVSAEAITDHRQSYGFWIDKEYLKQDFASVLSTSLHELTHKYGGDETSNFSYKLTDVMQEVLKATTDNPNIATQLKVLETAWNKL